MLAPALQGDAGTSWSRRRQDRGPVAYGAHWWLNGTVGDRRPYPVAPEDALIASGHWGQKLVVIPSRRLVVVRTADDRDGSFGTNDFLRLVLAAFAPEL
jgi:CubicO group peptidase (beta-lactamase class C family)